MIGRGDEGGGRRRKSRVGVKKVEIRRKRRRYWKIKRKKEEVERNK